MMPTRVRIGGAGGVWLDSLHTTARLTDSTIYRTEGWSGDYQASCAWSADPDYQAAWLHRGAIYQHIESGEVTWGGLVSEIERNDDGLTIHAYGYGAQADEYRALTMVSTVPTPSDIPNAAVDQAITDGARLKRYASLGATSVAGGQAGELADLTTLLDRAAKAAGQHWYVDSLSEITMVSDPTAPLWIVQPRAAYMGTADDDYVTHLYGLYVSSVDGTTGLPNGYGVVLAKDDEAAIQFGRKAREVDLTPLGVLSAPAAQDNINGRFALVGARMGWTNGIELTPGMLRRLSNGAITSPMSLYGAKGAGSMLRIPGITDTRSQPTTRGSIDIVLGQVTRDHEEQRATALPVGFTPRDFEGALAPAERPETSEAA